MLTLKTILHPTDFSERSEFAFRLACALARDYGAQLLVLHIMAPAVLYGEGMVAFPIEGYEHEAREKLQQLQTHDPKVSVEHRLAEGDPTREILRVAQEAKCDLIVMGTHGWTGLGRFLMGSVAEGVVRKAPCPVLTVKMPVPEVKSSGESSAEKAGKTVEVSQP
jgi:nucleotide-binding universal stress UspA family protein